jgi:23S rRNA pseudouridine2605 synthase
MTKADTTKSGEGKGERIAKRMARAGLCSRRDAEAWIAQGRVQVNGEVLKTPACVVTETDVIEVDGTIIGAAEKTRLFIYHKPAGLVTTNKDEKGRETIYDKMPEGLPRVVSVGRLDMNSEGLLLLTNDGGLARYLELPATGWRRRYRVRVHGHVSEKKLARLKDGIKVDGVQYKSIEAKIDSAQGTNSWLTVVLVEGKNREIRRVMEALDLKVNRLIRTAYGPFELGELPKGVAVEVRGGVLKSQCAGYFKGQA